MQSSGSMGKLLSISLGNHQKEVFVAKGGTHMIGASVQIEDEKENRTRTHKIFKKLRFDEKNNYFYQSTHVDRNMRKEVWYSLAEMKQFKKETYQYVKKLRCVEKDRTDSFTFTPVFLGAYDACCRSTQENNATPLTDAQRRCLSTWMDTADRWGLEKHIVQEIRCDVLCRKLQLQRIIFETHFIRSHANPDLKAEYLRKACQIVSYPSEMFARLIGEAEATALRKGD